MFEVVGPISPQWIPAAAFLMHRVSLSPPFATPLRLNDNGPSPYLLWLERKN